MRLNIEFYIINLLRTYNDTEAIISDDNYKTVRYSSNALYCSGFDDGYDNDLIEDNISEMRFMKFIDFGDYFSQFYLHQSDTTLIFDDFNNSQIKVKDIIYGYTAKDITLNCFIRKNSTYTFDVIVDPAYMHSLPVYHSNSASCDYVINDLKIKADTINFTASVSNNDSNLREALKGLDSAYVYSQVTLDAINCSYGINSGYKSTASIKNYKLLTEDTERVLTRAFLFDNAENKAPEMLQVYNTLISNMDIINTDLTLGITLLD